MKLTIRDIEILQKVHECFWLSTSQIKQSFFPGTSLRAINKRLNLLMRNKYLVGKRKSLVDEYYFRIGVSGKIVLVNAGLIESEKIKIPRKLPIQLVHFSRINDLRWYAWQAVLKRQGNFEFYFIDRELEGLFGKLKVIPDAVFGFSILENQKAFIIEYDRNTESLKVFADKIQRYYEGFKDNHNLWSFPDFRVLVVADTRQRINQLIGICVQILKPEVDFLFASLEDIKNENDLFAAIWVNPLQIEEKKEFKLISCID
jgi:hypothetical protein